MFFSRMYGEVSDDIFALKCLMKETPFTFVSIATGISILYFGQALALCEGFLIISLPREFSYFQRPLARPYFDETGQYVRMVPNNVHNMENSMWVVILTMTTVGYGDFYPRTTPGRIVAFFVCVWGVYVVSFTVLALTRILEPSKLEHKVFYFL